MSASPRDNRTGSADVVAGAGGVVVNDEGKVLLIHHRNGTWVFPKGHIDPGETPLVTALREVAEESGVEAHCPDPDEAFETVYVNSRNEQRVITWFVLLTDARSPEMREETFPEGAFLSPADALERLSYEVDRSLLERVLSSRAWPGGAPAKTGAKVRSRHRE